MKKNMKPKGSMITDYFKKIDKNKTPMANKGKPVILIGNGDKTNKRNGDRKVDESATNRYPKRKSARRVNYKVDVKDKGIKKEEAEIDVKREESVEENSEEENSFSESEPIIKKDNQGGLSAYELKRLETIKQNQAMLASLNLTNNILLEPFKIQQLKEKEKKKKKAKVEKIEKRVLPVRQSRRLKGLTPSSIEDKKVKIERREERVYEEDRDVPEDGKFEVKDTFLSLLDGLNENEDVKQEMKEEIKQENNEIIDDNTFITNQLQNIKCITHRALKVCDERIYRMQFHSNKEKVLLSVGSKVGEVSLLDASYYVNRFKNKEYIEDLEYDYEAHLHRFRPHYHTISGLKFQPNQEHCLLTCSYDNTIKKMDLNQQESITTFNYLESKDLICSLDINKHDINLAYFSTINGNIGLHDLRDDKAKIHKLSNKKIGTISLNPKYEHIFATASLDRTVKIYDSRYLNEGNYLYQDELSLSVSSAHFDPTGKKLVTTSFENTIKVYEYNNNNNPTNMDFSPNTRIHHNCRTGRFVTIFQAKFHPDPIIGHQVITIGDMERKICFYNSINSKPLVRFANKELISAIPAVVEYHPKVRLRDSFMGNLLATGNNGGKILMLM
ncbi:WD40 repeat-like protein [Neoconidiobolus thromboides FSU 785]|nr:WD40 repeat-like protein [Neoconidiobolus thromboides FSU 785]